MASRTKFSGLSNSPADTAAQSRAVEELFADRLQQVHALPQDVPIDMITPNPFQARKSFTNLDALADSMRVHGFTSRLRVRPAPGQPARYQLVFGERRWRAAQLAGISTIPCDIAPHTDEDMIEIGLAENIQRQDLDPLEEAQAFKVFIDEQGYSIRRLAERIGKDKGYVQGRLELLRAPEDVQALVVDRPDTLDAARQISKLADPADRQPLIEGLKQHTLSSRDVRAAVKEKTSELDSRAVATVATAVNEVSSAAGTARSSTPTAAPTADATLATVRERIAHDQQLVEDIVNRWNDVLATGDPHATKVLRTALEDTIARFSRLLPTE